MLAEWSAILRTIGAPSEADIEKAEALSARAEASGDEWLIATGQLTRTFLAFGRGDMAAAGRLGLEYLRFGIAMNDIAPRSPSIEPYVMIMLALGDPEAAAVTQGAKSKTWQRYGVQPPLPFWELIGRPDPLPAIREALGPDRFEAAVERGERMSVEELLDYIEATLERTGQR